MSKSNLFNQFEAVVLFDCETNGLDPEKNQIIELAALKVTKDGKTKEMDVFIKLPDGQKLPERIVSLTGITDEMLQNEGITEAEAAGLFTGLLSPKVPMLLVAHNMQFDLMFSLALFKRTSLSPEARIKALDTLTVYKDRAKYPHKLADAIKNYNLEDKVRNSHRAIDDVKALYEVLKAMDQERPDLADYINLFGYNPKYGVSGTKLQGITYEAQSYYNQSRLPDILKLKGVRK